MSGLHRLTTEEGGKVKHDKSQKKRGKSATDAEELWLLSRFPNDAEGAAACRLFAFVL